MKFSVAMATYNGEPWLEDQLQSILDQAPAPDELVICDDGSTDATPGIVTRFADASPFPVRFSVNPQRLGPAQNFARAIQQCNGDLIALADQDDRWHPDKLQRLHDTFATDDSINLVFSDLRLIDTASNPIGSTQWQALGFNESLKRKARQDDVLGVLLRFNIVTGAAMAFRASLRDPVLPIPEQWMHDEWIALIAAVIGKVVMIEDVLQDYRVHADQNVGPGVRGLFSQLAYAKAHMDTTYFCKALHRANTARQRLSTTKGHDIQPDTLDVFNEWVQHQEARLKMRESRTMRSRHVMHELALGRYRRFGYGWKSAAQDLLLR